MNHIRNIVKHPATKEIMLISGGFGFTFGGIFGAIRGYDRWNYNHSIRSYNRPKYINPSVYFWGNLIVMPLIGATVGAISCGAIGATAPVSLPVLYLCKDEVKKILVRI